MTAGATMGQRAFTLDDVLASPTPESHRLPNGATILVTEDELVGEQAARVLWSRWYGPSIALHSRLSVVDTLRALRWASQVIEEHVQIDPSRDLECDLVAVDDLPCIPAQRDSGAVESLPGPSDRWGRGIPSLVCIGCGDEFNPDSSPHLDRCWSCAELADSEAGVQ